MIKTQIGTNAGKIWHILKSGGLTDTSIHIVKKVCKLNDFDFFMALGWLARENKIKFLEGKSMYIYLND